MLMHEASGAVARLAPMSGPLMQPTRRARAPPAVGIAGAPGHCPAAASPHGSTRALPTEDLLTGPSSPSPSPVPATTPRLPSPVPAAKRDHAAAFIFATSSRPYDCMCGKLVDPRLSQPHVCRV